MRKRWLVLPAVLIALFAIAFFWLRITFTPDRLRALVEPRLEAALGHPVELGRVSLSTFPLAVRAENVRILAPAGFTSPALAEAGAIELRPRLAPLLRRQLAVQSIGIDAPRIWLEQRADGIWNWAAARDPGGAASGKAAASKRSGLALTVEKLRLTGGQVDWRSQILDVAVHTPLAAELELRADPALRDVRLEGWITADTLHVDAGGKLRGWRGPRLRLEPRIAIDVPDSSAKIESLRLGLNEAVLDIQGTVRKVGGKPQVALATHGESIDLAQLLAALPASATASTPGLRAAGNIRLDLQLDARPPALPVMHGRIDLQDGSLQMANLPDKLSAIGMRLEFAGDSLRVEEVSAKFGTAPVRVTGLVMQPLVPLRTRFDLQVAAQLDLAQVSRSAPMPPGTSLTGRADIDVRARGRTARPDSVWVQGPIWLHGVEVRTPLLRVPLRAEAQLAGAGDVVRIESAQLAAGASQVTLTGTLVPALPPRRPRLEFRGQSLRLDLVQLLPAQPAAAAAAAPAANASIAAATSSLPPLLPAAPPAIVHGTLQAGEVVLPAGTLRNVRLELRGDATAMDVDLAAAEMRADQVVLQDATGQLRIANQAGTGKLQAARAVLQKISATDLSGDLSITGRQMSLANMRGKAYGGTLRGSAKVDLQNPALPGYDLDLAADKLDASVFLGSISPLRNVITGTVDLKSGWQYTGRDPKQILASLTGNGQAAAQNGVLQGLPVLNAVSSLVQLPSLERMPFRDLGLGFDIQKGRMVVRDMLVHANDADIGLGGSIGLDGGLDLALHLLLSEAATKRYLSANRTAATVGSLFSDSNGRLVFDFKVGGQYKSPQVNLDLQKTASSGGVAKLTSSLLERVLGKTPLPLPGLPLPAGTPGAASTPGSAGTTPPAGGSSASGSAAPAGGTPASPSAADAQRATEEAARRAAQEAAAKLNDKLGGLFKRGAAPRDTSAPADSARPR